MTQDLLQHAVRELEAIAEIAEYHSPIRKRALRLAEQINMEPASATEVSEQITPAQVVGLQREIVEPRGWNNRARVEALRASHAELLEALKRIHKEHGWCWLAPIIAKAEGGQ